MRKVRVTLAALEPKSNFEFSGFIGCKDLSSCSLYVVVKRLKTNYSISFQLRLTSRRLEDKGLSTQYDLDSVLLKKTDEAAMKKFVEETVGDFGVKPDRGEWLYQH